MEVGRLSDKTHRRPLGLPWMSETGGKAKNKMWRIGGADGIRTHDLLDAIEARSQLRHSPTRGVTKEVYHSPMSRTGAKRANASHVTRLFVEHFGFAEIEFV